MNGIWVSLIRLRASAGASHATSSNSGTWMKRPEWGGHSMVNWLLTASAGSRSPSTAHATTRFENGVLTLTLPKTPDAKPKQIKVEPVRQIGAGAAAS